MATLNTLRNKGGVLLAVVIGVALLAFVLGDLLTSGSALVGSDKMTVGSINGEKIQMQQFSTTLDELSEIQRITTGQQSTNDEQNEQVRQQAWEMLIRQKAFNPEAATLGLIVSEAELIALMSSSNPSPIVAQMFANPQTGNFDIEYLRSFVAQVGQDQTGGMQLFWNYIQREVADQSVIFKFKNLVDKASYVTDFEAKQMANISGATYNVEFAVGRYDAIADSTVAITDGELRAYYNKNKAGFKDVDMRQVEYVTFEALPSPEDYATAEKAARQMAQDLATAANVQQYVTMNSSTPFDTRYYASGELTGELAGFAFTATGDQIYGPLQNGDQWTMARVSDVRMIPDSIRLSHIVLAATDTAKADSLVAALSKAGSDFAAAVAANSMDQSSSATGGDLGMIDPQGMAPMFTDVLKEAKVGDVKVINTGEAIRIIKLTAQTTPVRKVQLGILNHNIEASETTRNEAYTKANKFATEAGSNFNKAVTENALAKRVASVRPNDRVVGGMQSSRELARWAWNGKKGDVSQVMEFGNNFVIATVTEEHVMGVAPFEQAKEAVRVLVLNEKKAQMIKDKLQGATTFEAMAAAISKDSVETASDLDFQGFMAPGIGFDPAFIGGVSALQSGAVSKPIVGRIGVYVAKMVSKTENSIQPEMERARLVAANEQNAFMSAYQAFLEMSSINDARYRFY